MAKSLSAFLLISFSFGSSILFCAAVFSNCFWASSGDSVAGLAAGLGLTLATADEAGEATGDGESVTTGDTTGEGDGTGVPKLSAGPCEMNCGPAGGAGCKSACAWSIAK